MIIFVLTGCATLPKDFNRIESHAFLDTDNTRLGLEISKEAGGRPGESGVYLLEDGLDAFVARVVLIHLAERSIDVQYYLYHDDLVGLLFTDQLVKAADKGVRVRVLVDDMDMAGRDMGAAAMDSHPNMEVRLFNPFSRKAGRASQLITRMGSVTRRMHNKSLTVDNQASILGGRNIGDAYFDADPDLAFSDLDVITIGPVVKEVSSSFDRYWNSDLSYPAVALKGREPTLEEYNALREKLDTLVMQQADSPYLKALENSNLARKIKKNQVHYSWGDAHLIYDEPEKILRETTDTEFHLLPQLLPYLEGVEKELIIFSPYFVPGKPGTAFLTHLVEKGVRVRILTNSLSSNDVPIVHSGYAKYRKQLLRAGVELHELNKKKRFQEEKSGSTGSSTASLHAKSFVLDREHVFIGSLNLDPRSVVHNTEIGVVVTSKEVAGKMGEGFDREIEAKAFRLELVENKGRADKILWHGKVDGRQVTLDKEPYTGFWKRFGNWLMGLLPIESQL